MREYMYKNVMTGLLVPVSLTAVILALSGCGDSFEDTIPVTANPTVITSLQVSATPTTVKSDNSNSTTITIAAVNSGNAAVPDETITLSADTGLLSTGTVTTDATGIATATFSSGTFEKANRTATITATAGGVTSLLPVQIVGSTLTLSANATALLVGTPQILTITARDAGGTVIPDASVALTQTGAGAVTFTPASGTTNASGVFAVNVSGVTAGAVTVSATAVGATATIDFIVTTSVATTFGIDLLTLDPAGIAPPGAGVVPVTPKTSSMKIGDTLEVRVNAPTSTNVIFGATVGTWVGACSEGSGLNTCTATVIGGSATATLESTVAGNARVEVRDLLDITLSDNLTVGITAKTPDRITLQGTPTVIPMSVGTTLGYSNLTAMVYDATGAPVGGAPVAFSIVPGTGTNSGETISPVVVFTNSTGVGGNLGEARTTFTSGSLPSGQNGVQIRASVPGATCGSCVTASAPIHPPIATEAYGVDDTPSSNDAAIKVGGQAGSVAFGQATVAENHVTYYIHPMSVLVADSNGNPAPEGTVVNISAWPIAWSTGPDAFGCTYDPDGKVYSDFVMDWVPGNGGTFFNEDANENLILDSTEDGVRTFYATPTVSLVGSKDGQITPLNSYGGTVASVNVADLPGTVTTDASGVGNFNVVYTKSSALHVITRLRAQTMVQGTPAVGQIEFRMRAVVSDYDPKCLLDPSIFNF